MKDTLEAARNEFFSVLKDGSTCPCCGRYGQEYSRQITGAMAYGLILMARQPDGKWIHLNKFLVKQGAAHLTNGMMPLLRFWGLLEPASGRRADGCKDNGIYRVTALGRAFVKNETTVPRNANLYNNMLYSLSGKPTSIKDALKKKFSYAELMGLSQTEFDL